MQFDSLTFLVFLASVFTLYWRLDRRSQNVLLLVASYVFYGWWDWRFLTLIFISSAVDYSAAIGITESHGSAAKRGFLLLSIAVNLGILGVFKYYDFFAESLSRLLAALGFHEELILLNVILPVGISFYTFQTMSYTIDVYRMKGGASRDPVSVLAYVAFFPQLAAGPIERAFHLLPQFEKKREFNWELAHDGIRQMLYGLFLKIVLANNLAFHVDRVFDTPFATGWSYWLATYQFAFQIYADFAGYSHIAVGTAKLFGFSICRNFAYPYFSTSIPEFWSRWHISLSTWFRDYVYIPLGGSRVGRVRHRVNILVTFLLSGLWHGAAWNFFFWGLLHGLLVCFHQKKQKRPIFDPSVSTTRYLVPNWREFAAMVLTFHIVCVGWVFFRAPGCRQALAISSTMLWDVWTKSNSLHDFTDVFLAGSAMKTLCLIGGVTLFEWCMRNREHPLHMNRLDTASHWAICYSFALAILLFGHVGQVPFIYFQF